MFHLCYDNKGESPLRSRTPKLQAGLPNLLGVSVVAADVEHVMLEHPAVLEASLRNETADSTPRICLVVHHACMGGDRDARLVANLRHSLLDELGVMTSPDQFRLERSVDVVRLTPHGHA